MRIRPVLKVLLSPRRTFWENEHLAAQLARALDRADRTAGKLAVAESLLAQATGHLAETRETLLQTGAKLVEREASLDRAVEDRDNLSARLAEATRFAPPGHFYSPVPSREDIARHMARRNQEAGTHSPHGIDLAENAQLELLACLKAYYPGVPFKAGDASLLYRLDNPHYSYTDASILFCMLRHLKPNRLIEIGSGFSTCAILDTNRLFMGSQVRVTAIEPYPDLVRSLVARSPDALTIVPSKLQDTDLRTFDELRPGDILFIDSTHVGKAGSDVNYVFSGILPRLANGVVVHLHDIYRGFDYPDDWLLEGRAWNEAYFLRAFLEYNSRFNILLFTHHMQNAHEGWFRENMPETLLTKGSSFWMQKV